MATAKHNPLRFHLRHTMIPVGDLARSVDFYHRLFGMTMLRQRPDQGDGRATAYVGYGHEEDSTVLELIAGTGERAAPWAGHIAISVSDLTALCATLESEGVRFLKPLQAPSGGTRRFFAHIADPDGIEIELSEPREP